jgi:hypothetical protein
MKKYKSTGKGKKSGHTTTSKKIAAASGKTRVKVERERSAVFWCQWRGVSGDTIDQETGERSRVFDGTQWGTWIVVPENTNGGQLERAAWEAAACQFVKPEPRPERVVTRMGPDGNVIVTPVRKDRDASSATYGQDVPDNTGFVCSQSLQEVQERMHLESVQPLGYSDQMQGPCRYGKRGIQNLLSDYPLETTHLRLSSGGGDSLSSITDAKEDNEEDDDDEEDEIFGSKKKKVKA